MEIGGMNERGKRRSFDLILPIPLFPLCAIGSSPLAFCATTRANCFFRGISVHRPEHIPSLLPSFFPFYSPLFLSFIPHLLPILVFKAKKMEESIEIDDEQPKQQQQIVNANLEGAPSSEEGPSPPSEDPLQQQDKEREEASPYLTLFDSSTTCSSSSSSTSSKSKCGDCDRCRAAEEEDLELDDLGGGQQKGEEPVQIWPIRPDAKWKVRTVGLLAALLPGIGCYFCLAYTYTLQFDKISNFTIPSTFCPGLKSIFPPVSYSIGVWKPQKYIWLMVLALHLPPRFFYAIVYKNHYSLGESEYRNRRWFAEIIRLHYILLVAEAFGLTSVSVIDIESHFRIHATCFALWLIPFNFNMLFNNLLHYHSGIRKLKPMHDRVFQLKCCLFLVGYPLSVTTAISYLTFVLTCNTIPYATFSLAEYVLVGINSIFYFLLVWEFDGSKVEVYVKHRHQITRNDICI